jgi:hypothetical protein
VYLERVPHSALQLPPGCRPPPPAAFFLVEQLLREAPSAAAMDLAIKLLRSVLGPGLPAGGDHQQRWEQPSSSSELTGRQRAACQLQAVACCSLATSLVQAVVHNRQLASDAGAQLWQLVSESVQAAAAEVAAQDRGSSRWSYAASLAAAVAAGAYTAHLGDAGVTSDISTGSAPQATSSSSSSNGCAYAASAAAASSGSQGSSGVANAAGAAGGSAGSLAQGGQFPADCSVCRSAIQTLCDLRCLEVGVAFRNWASSGGAVAFVEAAQRHSITQHQHLQHQLLALAWRYPLPGVCGNVLCGRLEGPSAVDVVWNRVGTLCGRCRAAWYCCEGCQRAAWEAHIKVCRPGC